MGEGLLVFIVVVEVAITVAGPQAETSATAGFSSSSIQS